MISWRTYKTQQSPMLNVRNAIISKHFSKKCKHVLQMNLLRFSSNVKTRNARINGKRDKILTCYVQATYTSIENAQGLIELIYIHSLNHSFSLINITLNVTQIFALDDEAKALQNCAMFLVNLCSHHFTNKIAIVFWCLKKA
mmetsp:Transcript_31081/g.50421  ORF Transcript_31081/g.50421 Transcript_31081/m.50421 type:complete len:142 (-) Transcript_31081:507-932(-)